MRESLRREIIGKADEGNLQVRLEEGSGDGNNAEDPKRSARVLSFTDYRRAQGKSAPLLLYFFWDLILVAPKGLLDHREGERLRGM